MSSLCESVFSHILLVCVLLLSSVGMSGRLKKLKNMIFKKKRDRLSERQPPINTADTEQITPAPLPACRVAPSTTANRVPHILPPSAQPIRADDIDVSDLPHDQSPLASETDDDEDQQPSEPIDGTQKEENDGESSVGEQLKESEEERFSLAPVDPPRSHHPIDYRHEGKMLALGVLGTAIVDRIVEHRYNRSLLPRNEPIRQHFHLQPHAPLPHFDRSHRDMHERTHDERDGQYLSPTSPNVLGRTRDDDHSFRSTATINRDGSDTESSMEQATEKDHDAQHREEQPTACKQRPTSESVAGKEQRAEKEGSGEKAKSAKQQKQPTTASKEASQKSRIPVPDRPSTKPEPLGSSKVKKAPKPVMTKPTMTKPPTTGSAKATTSAQGQERVNTASASKTSNASRVRVSSTRGTSIGRRASELPKITKHPNMRVGDLKGHRGGEIGRKPGGDRRRSNERRRR